MFSTRSEYKIVENFVNYSLPVPETTPFPFSMILAHEEEGSVYIYHENSDGSTGGDYNYKMVKSDIKLDKNRNPKPMALNYQGINLPEAVYEISPVVDDNGKSGLWWIGEDFGGGLFVLSILHNAVDYGFLPVIAYRDIQDEKEVEILERKSVFIPFRTEEISEIKNAIKAIVESSDDGIRIIECAIKQAVGEFKDLGVNVDFCKLRFPYRAWIDDPKKPRIIYAILISDSFIETCDEDAKNKIYRSVAINKAVSYTNRLTAMSENAVNSTYVWEGINKINELRINYSDDVGLAECLICALYNFAVTIPNSNESEKCITMMESIYYDGYEPTSSMTSMLINVYGYALHKKIRKEDDILHKVIDIWENGFINDEQVSVDTAELLNHIKDEQFSYKIDTVIEKIYTSFPQNAVIAQTFVIYKVWEWACKNLDSNCLTATLCSMMEISHDVPCVCYLYEICTLDTIDNADELKKKLLRIDTLRKKAINKTTDYYALVTDNFFDMHLNSVAESKDLSCVNAIVEYLELSQKRHKKIDERFYSLYAEVLSNRSKLSENIKDIRTDVAKIKALITSVKSSHFKEEAVLSLAKAYGSLIKKQSGEDAIKTFKMIESLPTKYKIKSSLKYQEKIIEILTESFFSNDSSKAQWAIEEIESIRYKTANEDSEFADRIVYNLGNNLLHNNWDDCKEVTDYVVKIINLFPNNQQIREMASVVFSNLYWHNELRRQNFADMLETLFTTVFDISVWEAWLLMTFLMSRDKNKDEVMTIVNKIHELWEKYTDVVKNNLLPEIICFGLLGNGKISVSYLAPYKVTGHENVITDSIESMKEILGERQITEDDLVFSNPPKLENSEEQ